ncbi:MAG: ribonuclease D [Candidatus Odinarchaeota archaeon]
MNRIRIKGDKKPVVLVQTNGEVRAAIKEIRDFTGIAVDTEGDSFYRYYEKVCLIQIATPDRIYLIDPLSPIDIMQVKELLENTKIEKVFHDAAYDILLLKKSLDIHPVNIFDTQIAASKSRASQPGLKRLLEKYVGINVSKKMKLADWGKRPLTERMIEYAATDVRYLLEIKEELLKELNSLDGIKTKCKRLEKKEPKIKVFNPEKILNLPEAAKFSEQEKAALRRLYIWREEEAKKNDRPPFMIMQKKTLIELVKRKIKTIEDVKPLLGKKQGRNREFCSQIYSALKGEEEE